MKKENILHGMILSGILVIGLALAPDCYANANDSRWQEIQGENCFLDTQTIEYNKETSTLTYWVKHIAGDKIILDRFTADLVGKTCSLVYEVKDGPGDKHIEHAFNVSTAASKIMPDHIYEKTLNMICDRLELPPVLGVREHEWKLIWNDKDELGARKDYICADYVEYDSTKKTARVLLRSVWDRSFTYTADVDLNHQMILYVYDKTPRMAAPDTIEEAIYNATKELIRERKSGKR